MQHSRESVNTRYLACSVASSHRVRAMAGGKGLLTCGVITGLHQASR